ncbi:hypothetical protein LCGC14_2043200, partial [marine sediment metagenome]
AVTFEEHQGRISQALKERFPLDYEVREKEEAAELDATMERNTLAQRQYETAWRQYWENVRLEYERYTGYDADDRDWADVLAHVFPGLDLDAPDFPVQRPEPPVLETLPELQFADLAARLGKLLPKTEVHSGAGLYVVDASGTTLNATVTAISPYDSGLDETWVFLSTQDGDRVGHLFTFVTSGNSYPVVGQSDIVFKLRGDASGELVGDSVTVAPYSTIQSALDQFWTDQGSTLFTASQYVRIFAGTYDETVTPNAGLNPDEANGFLPFMEGDPTDDRDNIKIQPTTGNGIYINCDYMVVRHLRVYPQQNATIKAITTSTGCQGLLVSDCYLRTENVNGYCIFLRQGHHIDDCIVVSTTGHGIGGNTGHGMRISGCTITVARIAINGLVGNVVVERTVVSGADSGLMVTNYHKSIIELRDCTFYNCDDGLKFNAWSENDVRIINCIFKDCTDVIHLTASLWPEETATRFGPSFTLRNNCYHGYTNFANDGGVTKTHAEFIAFNRVDASGDLDGIDPLLLNPGAGDFSLQDGSPCVGRGVGAGVTKDVNGDVMDAFHPDIGAVRHKEPYVHRAAEMSMESER